MLLYRVSSFIWVSYIWVRLNLKTANECLIPGSFVEQCHIYQSMNEIYSTSSKISFFWIRVKLNTYIDIDLWELINCPYSAHPFSIWFECFKLVSHQHPYPHREFCLLELYLNNTFFIYPQINMDQASFLMWMSFSNNSCQILMLFLRSVMSTAEPVWYNGRE